MPCKNTNKNNIWKYHTHGTRVILKREGDQGGEEDQVTAINILLRYEGLSEEIQIYHLVWEQHSTYSKYYFQVHITKEDLHYSIDQLDLLTLAWHETANLCRMVLRRFYKSNHISVMRALRITIFGHMKPEYISYSMDFTNLILTAHFELLAILCRGQFFLYNLYILLVALWLCSCWSKIK